MPDEVASSVRSGSSILSVDDIVQQIQRITLVDHVGFGADFFGFDIALSGSERWGQNSTALTGILDNLLICVSQSENLGP